MHFKGYSSREIELSGSFCSKVDTRSKSIGERFNAGILYFKANLVWSIKSCRSKQHAVQMDADLPRPFSFNYDDVIFRVQTFKNSQINNKLVHEYIVTYHESVHIPRYTVHV